MSTPPLGPESAPDSLQDLIQSALTQPAYAILYYAGRRLRERWPGKVIVECGSCGFDLDGYVDAGHAGMTPLVEYAHAEVVTAWRGCVDNDTERGCATGEEGIVLKPANAFLRVAWRGREFEVLRMSWRDWMRSHQGWFLIGEDRRELEEFYGEVCRWTGVPHGEVLVFQQGNWRKDRELFESIQGSTFETLVLADGLRDQLREDVAGFFARREVYAEHGVPWKRGILLLGPPGNGKTHAVKSLCHASGVPVLYVRSLEPAGVFGGSEHASIASVFELARQTAPCLLVLEDLDALIKPTNRSVFLNELDGFASNSGVCVVATTNFPERLDPSILDRPSRFDRKYTFGLPGPAERGAYLELWNRQQAPELTLSPEGIEAVVLATEGFSFAYLKELCLAATMAWINAGDGALMDSIALQQARTLQAQRESAPGDTPPPEAEPTAADRIRDILRGNG